MTYTLTGITSLGTVTSEEHSKDAGLFQQPLPGTDASSAILLDLFGCSRTITITGRYTVSDGTISTFITQLDALVDGAQTGADFHSDKSNATYNVLITGVSWKSVEGGVNFVEYIISMIEGSV